MAGLDSMRTKGKKSHKPEVTKIDKIIKSVKFDIGRPQPEETEKFMASNIQIPNWEVPASWLSDGNQRDPKNTLSSVGIVDTRVSAFLVLIITAILVNVEPFNWLGIFAAMVLILKSMDIEINNVAKKK